MVGPLTDISELEDDHPSAKHPRVHALADMLDVPKLKNLAIKKLKTQLTNWVAADFPAMVKEAYSSTTMQDRGIRDLLVTTSKDHIDELLLMEDFKTAMEEFGEFSAALVVVISGRVVSERVVSGRAAGKVVGGIICGYCGNTGGFVRRCSLC